MSAAQQKSLFTRAAKKIGRDLASTFARLEKLTILVKQKTIFDDKSNEIQELTSHIRHDMTSLNNQIAKLQELAKHQGGDRKQLQTHSSAVVIGLQSRLAAVSNDFKTVLETRTENLKQAKSRRDLYSQAPISSSAVGMAPRPNHGSVFQRDSAESQLRERQPPSILPGPADDQTSAFAESTDHVKYHQQIALIDEQDSYLHERANAMQQIEQTIVELGGIFQQLASMVHQQDELITRIDSNIESTQMNVEAAHTELLRYFQSISSNRWLMVKIFGVALVFFLIFVVFML